jgi:hypothetical protein
MESNNSFEMVQNGYAFFSAKKDQLEKYMSLAKLASQNGSGEVRINEEFNSSKSGIDIFSDNSIIKRLYPSVNPQVEVAMRVRRAGYLNVPKLGTFSLLKAGNYLFEQCLKNNVEFMRGSIDEVLMTSNKQIEGVKVMDPLQEIEHRGTHTIHAPALVLAVGPYLKQFGQKMDVDFAVMNEQHSRVEVKDPKNVIPPELPFMIWSDNVNLPWSDQDKKNLQSLSHDDPRIRAFMNPIAVPGLAGPHLRPLSDDECNGERYDYLFYKIGHFTAFGLMIILTCLTFLFTRLTIHHFMMQSLCAGLRE